MKQKQEFSSRDGGMGHSSCASCLSLTAVACLLFSWDDSSSVSSGLSDTLDNISTDDLNTTSSVSSYSNITVPSRKNTQVRTAFLLFQGFCQIFPQIISRVLKYSTTS